MERWLSENNSVIKKGFKTKNFFLRLSNILELKFLTLKWLLSIIFRSVLL